MREQSRPESPRLARRTVLRTLLGGSLAGVFAGCNALGEGPSSPADAGTDSDQTAAMTVLAETATPLPSVTLTPTPMPTPSPTQSPTATIPPTVTPSPTASESPTPTGSPAATATATATESPSSTSSTSLVDDAETFVDRLDAGKFDAARDQLAPLAARQLSAETLHRLWLGLTAQHGAYETVADAERTTRNGAQVVVLALRCAEATQRARFTFDDDAIAGLRFPAEYSPPEYADESSFSERSVTVEAEGCPLPATLSVPDDRDAAPGVVLVHGSGPNDRDSTVGPNKPLKDLAWGLASRDVAVLRYEKRTAECDVPLDEWDIDRIVVDDAVDALDRLADEDEVDADRRFVVGHSLGALCAPRIAERVDGLAGGAMLSASARPMTELIRDQFHHLLSVDGELSDEDEETLRSVDEEMARVENGEVDPDETVRGLPGSWYASLLDYDQVTTAEDVSLPLALFQGGRDYQVPVDTEFERWRDALGDRSETRFELYPGLSHLFQSGTEPSLGMEYNFHDNVSESVVADLAAWIDETTA